MERMLDGFALHEIICNDQGEPVNYRFLDINPSFERLTGLTRDQLIGRTVLDVLPKTEQIWIERYGRVALTGEAARFEEYSGAIQKWFEIVAYRPEPRQFACIFQDITQRKLNEEEIRCSQERLKMIFENAPDPYYLHDLEGCIVDANKAAEDATGYTKEELVGKSFLENGLLQPSDLPKAMDALARSANGELTGPDEFEIFRKDGTQACLEVRAYPTKIAGQSLVLGIARDVTERKKAEREKTELEAHLRQSQKMEAIGTLAGGIAHDFNNVLAAILGYAELSLMELGPTSQIRQFVEEIRTATCRARDVVRQILTFSRQGENQQEPLKMVPLVKEVIKLLRASIPSFISIESSLQARDDWVMADATQMHQILMNLCTNAWHSMKDGSGKGVLSVSLSERQMNAHSLGSCPCLKDGMYLELAVKDTGCGISPEIRDRIFEPYFSTKRRCEGTGLGLAVVQGIVDSHGGVIKVESLVGEGSTFRVFLPLLASQKEVPAQDGVSALRGGYEHILFVDDEPALVQVGRITLERLGYRVTAKTDCMEALGTFLANPNLFDLVITDYAMPKMTGVELAQELTLICPDLPVLLQTGYSDTVNVEEAESCGVKKVMFKPLDQRTLSVVIRELLDQTA